MRVSLSYPDVPAFEIPDSNVLACLEPRAIEPSRPAAELAEEALDHPIGSPPLEELVSARARVLVLVDDITRQTPAWALLPAVFRRLAERGCGPERTKILIAAGTHSRMSQPEVEKKLGREIPRQYPVFIHHWRHEENLMDLGATRDGDRKSVRVGKECRSRWSPYH